MKIFSNIPVVIIPMNTVPIDFAMFIVSPFHKKFGRVNNTIPEEAQQGFEWHDDVEEEEGVDMVYDASDANSRNHPPAISY